MKCSPILLVWILLALGCASGGERAFATYAEEGLASRDKRARFLEVFGALQNVSAENFDPKENLGPSRSTAGCSTGTCPVVGGVGSRKPRRGKNPYRTPSSGTKITQ